MRNQIISSNRSAPTSNRPDGGAPSRWLAYHDGLITMIDISHRADSRAAGAPPSPPFFPPPDEGGRHHSLPRARILKARSIQKMNRSPLADQPYLWMGWKPKRLPFKISIPKKPVHILRFWYDRIFKIPNAADARSHPLMHGRFEKITAWRSDCRRTLMSLIQTWKFQKSSVHLNASTDFALPIPLP